MIFSKYKFLSLISIVLISIPTTIYLINRERNKYSLGEEIKEYVGKFTLGNSPSGYIVEKSMYRDIRRVDGEKICEARFVNWWVTNVFYFSHTECNGLRVLWDLEDKPRWNIKDYKITK